MAESRYLVDTSVLARGQQPRVRERLEAMFIAGQVRTCRMIDLEILFSTPKHKVAAVAEGRRALPEVPITPRTMDHALDIIAALAEKGRHRSVKATDCVIAACAIEAGIPVLHYDRDFERLAEATGLRAEWVAEPGSLDGG